MFTLLPVVVASATGALFFKTHNYKIIILKIPLKIKTTSISILNIVNIII
jgi:hypothetical protein